MIILSMEQGTPEWLAMRNGKPSASCFNRLITNAGKPSTQNINYINELTAELLTGKSQPFYKNEHMARGNELEPEARDEYEFITDNEVIEVGFVVDKKFEYGCSPDGLIGTQGGLEIKCPAQNTMVKYQLNDQELVKAYHQQVQGCMYLTGAIWWDVFAFHPDMAHVLVRVKRDDEFIKKLAVEIDAAVNAIKTNLELLS